MPNWCYSTYRIVGKKKEVQSLYSKMSNLERRRKPLVESDFGNTWLGCLVTKLGGDRSKVHCRGSWSELEYDGETISFNTETAWEPMNEVFRLVKGIYPSLDIYYSAEEDMMGYFITNDTEGRFFIDRYKVEANCETEYFTVIEDVYAYVSRITGRQIDSREELAAAIEEWNEGKDDYEEVICLNEFKVVKDEHL